MTPLRIVIDVRRIHDFGIGTYIRNLVQALAAEDLHNLYTLVIAPANLRDLPALPENFNVATYGRSDMDFADHLAFPTFLRQAQADLFHIPVNAVPLLMPKPYVVTIHDMASLLFNPQDGVRNHLRQFRFRRGLLRANRVIAVSAATRRDVENLMGVPPDRVRLVYSAPNPEFFSHRPVADARAAGPETARLEQQRILERYQIHYPFLLYAGAIRPQKNIPRLVEAFAIARAQLAEHAVYKDLRLIIIGDEISRYPSVRQAVMQSRVEDAVRFLGYVPFDTMRVFYEAAAAFVFPSLYEGFGLPPLEAMASGTPVITSTMSSLPEVVGDAAMLINPENVFDIARGIKEVLVDPALRASLISAGRERAAKYSWKHTAQQVLEIYREVAR
jgi:glycosyltransferase involved in cell wall biosynthesis